MPVNHREAPTPPPPTTPSPYNRSHTPLLLVRLLGYSRYGLRCSWVQRPQNCLFCQPIPSMPLAELTSRQPLKSPQPQKGFLTGPEPRPLPGLRYQGNFSISRLRLQIRPLADENKGLFMGSCAHLLLLHCVFYALSLKAFSQTSAIVFALTDGTKEKHRKLSGSMKVAGNVRAELRKGPRALCSQEQHLPTPGGAVSCQRP